MRYDAVLFDLDGTLTASGPGIFASIRHTLKELGKAPLDDTTLRRFIGPPMYDSIQRYGGVTETEVETALTIYREYYDRHGVRDAVVYTGIPNLLRALRAQGAFIALASAKPTGAARVMLEHFGLLHYFDRVIGAEAERIDSEKDAILRAALPARYEHAAMVGDRQFDMAAAKVLGLDAIGAGWGYGTPQELLSAGADVVAETVEDAARLLLGAENAGVEGFFISVEGLDGSGKTTQMNAIAEHLRSRGYDLLLTREPGGTPISEELRVLVLDPDRTMCDETEALLYAAARAQHVQDVIRPAIAQGRVVLCDRYVDSSIAYQGAGRELGMDRVAAINRFAIGDTMPDMTILLATDAQSAFLRRKSATTLDRLERAGEAFFARVYDAYAALAQAHPARIRCIDAQRGIEAVTADAYRQVDRLLASR